MKKPKDLLKPERKEKIIKLPISKYIDTQFRNYSIYTIENRGVPNFYDALTPVQRYILSNSPVSFTKTLSVVGKSIEDHYSHGNCLEYSTKINLAYGGQITIGEWSEKWPELYFLVQSKNLDNKLEFCGAHSPRIGQSTKKYIEIELESGEIIKCTLNHPFFINNQWVEARNIVPKDSLFSFYNSVIVKNISIIESSTPVDFYDITVDTHHNFSIGNSEIIVHNSSLEKAISKLARPFGSSLSILEGYGFFGSEVSPDPAAARYTSVKLSKEAGDILRKYRHLTTRTPEGPYDPFWIDLPIGLVTTIVGIAVGYKSTILPRKLEDIKSFLEGKTKEVLPYFKGFEGHIKRYNGLEKAWIISSKIVSDTNKMEIRELAPILNYSSILKKLDYLFGKYEGQIRIINNSNTKVKIDIIYLGKRQEEWKDIQDYINRVFSIIVTENIVFVKDGQILVYDNIEQYLEDYKWQIKRLKWKNTEYEREELDFDLTFNKAKKELIEFIIKKKRTVEEIDTFLSPYILSIQTKLEGLTSKKFTEDELIITKAKIKELVQLLKEKETALIRAKTDFNKSVDTSLIRGISSKRTGSVDLFTTEDIGELEGIAIWNGEDVVQEEEIIEEED